MPPLPPKEGVSSSLHHPLLPLPTSLLSLLPLLFLVGCITASSFEKEQEKSNQTLKTNQTKKPHNSFSCQIIIHHFSLSWSILNNLDDVSLVLFLSLQPCYSFQASHILLDFYFSSSSPLPHNTLQEVEASPILCPERLFITIDLNLVLLNHSYQHLCFFAF